MLASEGSVDKHSVLVIVNPTSRNVPMRQQLERHLEPLRRDGHRLEIAITTAPGDATRIAAQAAARGITRVGSCGGDGTLNEVINGVGLDGPVVAILPAGTGNVFAKEVAIPWNIEQAARLMVEAPVRRVDLGRANGRLFLLMCGIGLDGAVTASVPDNLKRRLGSTAYVLIGLRELLRFQPIKGLFELDGERIEREFYFGIVGNSRSYGGAVNITRRAFVDDGLLDVCLFGGNSLPRLARHALRIALQTHTSAHDILYRRVRTFTMPAPNIPLQLDGEAFGRSPLSIEAVPAGIQMVIPEPGSIFAHPPF